MPPHVSPPAKQQANKLTVKDLYKTKDNFTANPVAADTIWYLTINTPSEDTWAYHGPTKTFAALIPLIESAIASSKSEAAAAKWQKLLDDDAEEQRVQAIERETFGDAYLDDDDNDADKRRGSLHEVGITTFVIPRVLFHSEEGVHTILSVRREVNPAVYKMLPASVFTVTCEGPIPTVHVLRTEFEREKQVAYQRASGRVPTTTPAPRSTTSFIVGSYANMAATKTAATRAMDALLAGMEPWKVMRNEAWGESSSSTKKVKAKARAKGKARKENGHATGGLLMAMTSDARWEVKIKYEEDGLSGALERFDHNPVNVENGITATWRGLPSSI